MPLPFFFKRPVSQYLLQSPLPKSLGMPVQPVVQPAAPSVTQESRHTNPRAAAPVPTAVLEDDSFDLGSTPTYALGVSPTQDQTRLLPNTHDITDIILTLTGTPAGATAGTFNLINLIDHIVIQNSGGNVIQTLSPSMLADFYAEYSKHQAAMPSPTGGFSGSSSGVVIMPWQRLPAAGGPYRIQLFFATEAAAVVGLTGATGMTASADISVLFGDAQRGELHASYQTLALVAGRNEVASQMSVQNKSIATMFLRGFAADTDLSYVSLTVNGKTVIPYSTESVLSARWAADIQATRPTGVFILPKKSQMAFPAGSSSFVIEMATSDTINAEFYWIE